MSPLLVKAFQREHLNHLGKPLRVDGDLGPQTRWAMDFETICSERRAIIRAARKDIGLTESPPRSNTDPTGTIERWSKQCNARAGDPWCGSALSEWLSAAVPVRIAGALALGRRFPFVDVPFAGDIGSFPTGGGRGHCFLVIGVGRVGVGPLGLELMTIEGNSSNACRCVLRVGDLPDGLRFSRVVADTSGTCPGIVPSVPLAPRATR